MSSLTNSAVAEKRPSWNQYFMNIAREVAQRATCPRAKCGTILVDPKTNHILATGYNGAPPGEKHCISHGCIMQDNHCQRAIHAECNAIAHAARNGVRIDGAHAYIYGQRSDGEVKHVCRECAKILKAANVTVILCQGEQQNGTHATRS